jgi:hypothetical protein
MDSTHVNPRNTDVNTHRAAFWWLFLYLRFEGIIMNITKFETKADIQARHDEFVAKNQAVVDASSLTKEQAQELSTEYRSLTIEQRAEEMKKIMEGGESPLESSLGVSNAYHLLENLGNAASYFIGTARYLIIVQGVNLLSPAGFHYSDNVWTLSKPSQVQILSDRIPKHLSGVVAYDLHKCAGL